ncbi:hypothetical protein ACFE04_023576 [Oxalis oulophora]
MCRSTDFSQRYSDRNRLKITSFVVKFPSFYDCVESLTLLYLPRIDETELVIDGDKIRPDAAAFVTLHRSVAGGGVVFGSRERVKASEGLRFVVYAKDDKVIKGIFRKDEDDEWKLECKCETESLNGVVEVKVGVEGHVAVFDRVEMRKRKSRSCNLVSKLEEIPEERDFDDSDESDGGCCCTCDEEDDVDRSKPLDCEELEMEVEGVKWAVDMGFWVMCLGVGYLVSKATVKNLRLIRRL